MGRPTRIQFAGACYLVTLAGNNRANLFISNEDRRRFLALLRSLKARCGLKIHAYCLLDGKVMLVLETSQPNLSVAMQALGTSYTKRFNSAHNTAGHVFQGRYKALLVDKGRYLAEVTRYVHLEPVRASRRESPWRYPWSSCADYVQLMDRPGGSLVDADEVLSKFGRNKLAASVRYLQWLKERWKSPSDIVLPVVRGVAIGQEPFVSKALSRHPAAAEEGASRQAALSRARRIVSEVSSAHGMDEERLLSRIQWRDVCRARREAVHRVWREAGLGIGEIGRLFNRTPSAISQIISAWERQDLDKTGL